MLAMLTDVFIILLLIGGIGFASVVNARVKRLMALLQELEPAVQHFSDAVDKSEASVAQMQKNLLHEQPSENLPQADVFEADAPAFASRRTPQNTREMGVRVIRNKQDLVRRFFDLPRTAGRV